MYKISILVPKTHADSVREALFSGGAGRIGSYDSCSFSTPGIGRFRPMEGSDPYIGTQGRLESVEEEKIETVCRKENIRDVLKKVQEAHPYEEPVIDVWEILDWKSF